MHPILKRILVHSVLTAGILALLGVVFTHLASTWALGNVARPGAAEGGPALPDAVQVNVPLMMAFWGFVFVVVGELIRWRVFGSRQEPAKSAEPQPDDAEKLLNELLAQAESKMTLEPEPGFAGPGGGDGEQQGKEKQPHVTDQAEKPIERPA